MYAIFDYIGVVWGVNAAADIPVPWSVWENKRIVLKMHISSSLARPGFRKKIPVQTSLPFWTCETYVSGERRESRNQWPLIQNTYTVHLTS